MVKISDCWTLYEGLVLSIASERSIITETKRWQKHILPYFGEYSQTEEVTNKSILQFRAYLTKKRLSPQTVSHCLSLLRRVLHRAQQWELINTKIPVFDMPKFDNKRVRFLTKSEAEHLLTQLSLTSKMWHDISLLSLHTGLRAGEIFSLRTCHFDVQNSQLYIFDTKSNKNRCVPLNTTAKTVLERNCKGTGLIFYNKEGQIKQVSKKFREAVVSCKLNSSIQDRRQKVVFHTLRHTFASWLVQSGTPLIVVGQLLGHKTLHMTQRYAHLAPAQGINAVETLDQLLNYVNVDFKSF